MLRQDILSITESSEPKNNVLSFLEEQFPEYPELTERMKKGLEKYGDNHLSNGYNPLIEAKEELADAVNQIAVFARFLQQIGKTQKWSSSLIIEYLAGRVIELYEEVCIAVEEGVWETHE